EFLRFLPPRIYPPHVRRFFHFPPQSPSGLQEVLYEFCRLFDPCFLALGQNNFHLAARGALLLLRSCRAPFQVVCLSSIRQFRSLLPQVSSFFKEKKGFSESTKRAVCTATYIPRYELCSPKNVPLT